MGGKVNCLYLLLLSVQAISKPMLILERMAPAARDLWVEYLENWDWNLVTSFDYIVAKLDIVLSMR